jgi:hypothetical protein
MASQSDIEDVCRAALKAGKFVYLTHRGVARNVYPYKIKEGRLFMWCSLHPDREVESIYLFNIGEISISTTLLVDYGFWPSDFAP